MYELMNEWMNEYELSEWINEYRLYLNKRPRRLFNCWLLGVAGLLFIIHHFQP